MQSETAGFDPGAATWRTRRNASSLILAHTLHVINKTGSTLPSVLPSEEDRATATCNTYRKFGEIWTSGFWDMRADRHTERLIAILHTPTGDELVSTINDIIHSETNYTANDVTEYILQIYRYMY